MAGSPHVVRHSTKFQRPQRMIFPLLLARADPTKIFVTMPKKEDIIAMSIINKRVDDMLKDVQTSED